MANSKKQSSKAAELPQPSRRGKPKKKKPTAAKAKPLPPPVPVASAAPAGTGVDEYNLGQMFDQGQQSNGPQPISDPSSGMSSSDREPKPGQPLTPEAEDLLASIAAADDDAPEGEPAAPIPIAPAPIMFKTEKVRSVLEESFGWLAEKFDSDHWRLTDNQADMLAEPTTQLLGSLWTHVQGLMPSILARWSETTPGLMDFVLMFGFVVGPKVAKQISVSRERTRGPVPVPAQPRPVTSVPPRRDGPVGAINTAVEAIPFSE